MCNANFTFNDVGLLCGVKVVARFYTVQYEHMKQDVTACAFVIVSNLLGVYFCRELAKLDDIWFSYSKYKTNWKFDLEFAFPRTSLSPTSVSSTCHFQLPHACGCPKSISCYVASTAHPLLTILYMKSMWLIKCRLILEWHCKFLCCAVFYLFSPKLFSVLYQYEELAIMSYCM